MAMIKYGTGIEQYSGKYGGAIFYHDGCSYHQIAKPCPQRQHETPARLEVRRHYSRCCNYWSTKVAQYAPSRESWEIYGRTHEIINAKGECHLMTGWMYFLHITLVWPWEDWWGFILPPYADLPGWAPVWAPEDYRWR